MVTILICFFSFLGLIIWLTLFKGNRLTRNLPPGPKGLPIIGYLPWIYGKNTHEKVEKLMKKYGPIVSFYIGSRLVVFLGSFELIHEAYVTQGDKFAGKPKDSPMEIDGDEEGISISDGPFWKEQRRFMMKTLKDFGVGKAILEPEIKEEVKHLLQKLAQTNGRPTRLHETLGMSIANNICILEFGKRFEYDDPLFQEMKGHLDSLTRSLEIIHLPMYFPWMRKFSFFSRCLQSGKLKRYLKHKLYNFSEFFIAQHERQFQTEEHRDIIYAWLDEQNKRNQRNEHSVKYFNRSSLHFNLLSLFMAATETTNSTLLTAVIHMVQNPEIQQRCREEIWKVVERDRLPSVNDKIFLPFTEATLLEVQRLAVVNPLNLVHRTMEDTHLLDYNIPNDTIVFTNLWALHTNPDNWPEPHKFSPERFLNADGQVVNCDNFIPFSIGKRMCLGSALAKMEIFLYFTSLLQNFSFEAPPGKKFEIEYSGSVVRMPNHFEVCVKKIDF